MKIVKLKRILRSKFLPALLLVLLILPNVTALAADESWSSVASMSTARTNFQTEVIDSEIYAIGGAGSPFKSSAEVYNLATDTWTTLASMSMARTNFQTEIIDGKIYAIGGNNTSGNLSSFDVYNPATDTWTTVASMWTGRK